MFFSKLLACSLGCPKTPCKPINVTSTVKLNTFCSCQEEESNLHQLVSEKIRLNILVKLFKDSDEEFLKIKRIVQSRIANLSLDGVPSISITIPQ